MKTNDMLKKAIAVAAGASSLASGILWHISANAQVSAMKLSGQVTAALATLVASPNPNLEAQQEVIQLSQRAAEVLSQISADQNLYAAVFAVVSGLGTLVVAYFD